MLGRNFFFTSNLKTLCINNNIFTFQIIIPNMCKQQQKFMVDNNSKFIVFTSLLIFSLLLSLRLDGKITLSYWLIFSPLWLWKFIAISGATVGTIIWFKNPDYRLSNSSYIHFKSMLISVSLQLLLLMFELLVCDKLESRRHSWTLVFVPLIFISLLSISVCIWSIKNGCSLELEFFASVNILQFILIALKLDNFINWSWVVVFVPAWILMCFAIVAVLYAMIFAAILMRSTDIAAEQRRASLQSASSSSMVFLPMLLFLILLTSKLDSAQNSPHTPSYFITCIPLFITLAILTRLSFGSKHGSLWWFGMRTDFCTFLLAIFPFLKEYGNISFTIQQRNLITDSSATSLAPQVSSINTAGDNGGDNLHSRFYYNLTKKLFKGKDMSPDFKQLTTPVVPRLMLDAPD